VRELLANDARLRVHETAPHSVVRLAVNTRRAPLDRRETRQAIAHALDRILIAATITRGAPIVGSPGVIPPETPWFNSNLPAYDYDPERARALLNGEKHEVDVIADASSQEPELMAPMLEAVGISLNVQRVDTATRTQLLDQGNFQLALTQHIGVGGDPDFLRRWYADEETNAFARGSIFEHSEFFRLGNAQAATVDPLQRRQIILRMQEILAEELPTIVLYHRRFYWVYDPAVFTPMETWGGLMNGVPLPNNKLTLIER
jgi:peptide/nickel transport system substrate-binding protein